MHRFHHIFFFFDLEIVSDEALLEGSRVGVLNGEVPAAEDLVGHAHAVTFAEHPGVLVADCRSVERGLKVTGLPLKRSMSFCRTSWTPDLRTSRMTLKRRMLQIPARYSNGVLRHSNFREPGV